MFWNKKVEPPKPVEEAPLVARFKLVTKTVKLDLHFRTITLTMKDGSVLEFERRGHVYKSSSEASLLHGGSLGGYREEKSHLPFIVTRRYNLGEQMDDLPHSFTANMGSLNIRDDRDKSYTLVNTDLISKIHVSAPEFYKTEEFEVDELEAL